MRELLTISAPPRPAYVRESPLDERSESIIRLAIDSLDEVPSSRFARLFGRKLTTWVKNGCIYAFKVDGRDIVKIGWSQCPLIRLQDIQASMPDTLTFIGILPARRLAELATHELLKDHRIRTEWYHFNDDVRAFIETHLETVNGNADESIRDRYC